MAIMKCFNILWAVALTATVAVGWFTLEALGWTKRETKLDVDPFACPPVGISAAIVSCIWLQRSDQGILLLCCIGITMNYPISVG
jgi:hypothetical protein